MNRSRKAAHLFSKWSLATLTLIITLFVVAMILGLYLRSLPILSVETFKELLFTSTWRPFKGQFGFFPFIMGTLWVTATSVIIAIPIALLTAVYLSEYAGRRVRRIIMPFIDLLAGIPSVIYGIWGVIVVVPFIKDHIAPLFHVHTTGYTILTGSIVLAIMILPFVINVLIEVFQSVPEQMKEASQSLGATEWETIKHVVLKKSFAGIVAVSMLGVARAFGETMAVLMLTGNVPVIPTSVLSPGYPLPALIANNYGELLTVPLYDSALLFAALVLLVVVLFFNVASRLILIRVEEV